MARRGRPGFPVGPGGPDSPVSGFPPGPGPDHATREEVGDGGAGHPRTPPALGIVIPALNEERNLPYLLHDLNTLPIPARIVVADGGSTDRTREVARDAGAVTVEAARGRARQMNAGASALDTPWLFFLHADTRLPPPSRMALGDWLARAESRDFATFAFSLAGDHWFWRFIEAGQRIREKASGLAYGDQGLLLPRALFLEVGGFPDLPIMEDVEILRLLKKKGRWRQIPEPVLSSPRRYQEEGRWWGWLRNSALIILYLAGVAPEKLAGFYPALETSEGSIHPPDGQAPAGIEATMRGNTEPPGPRGPPPWERALLIFAKEPRPGHVKTRLAADIGPERAAGIYGEMGRGIVDRLRAGPFRRVVFFDPPEALPAVLEWLDPGGLEFSPQVPGDLGTRLEAAVREGFRRAEAVVVVGTDAPDLDSELVTSAFERLKEVDLVLGPAADGGYYLLGLKSEAPELFHGIPWSTPQVLATTLRRAKALGLSVSTLPSLSDVDTAEDLKKFPTLGNEVP